MGNRYDAPTRRRIGTRLKALHREGKSRTEMTEILNSEGFTCPKGGRLDNPKINQQCARLRLFLFKKNGQKRAAPTTVIDSNEETMPMVELVMQSGFTEERKLKMIKALVT